MSDTPSAGIGHNRPPLALAPTEINDRMIEDERSLMARRDELVGMVNAFLTEHPTITDDDLKGRASDIGKALQGAQKVRLDHFTTTKKPFLEGGREVERFFKSIELALDGALRRIAAPITAYDIAVEAERRAELARQAAEAAAAAARAREELARQAAAAEAARQANLPPPVERVAIETVISRQDAAETAERRASVKAADLTRSRGNFGSVASLRTLKNVELQDISKVPLRYLVFDQSLATQDVRAGRVSEIPGCRIFETKHTQIR